MQTQVRSKKKKGQKGGKRRPQYRRKRGRRTSPANEQLLQILKPSESDVTKLLAAQTHIGRRKAHVNMKRYIWKRRQDGIHVINLEKTWAKLMLAARILVTIRDPADICVMSTRTYGQRGAIKFAHYTKATALVGKWVPGTFTNPQNKAFYEPRLVIVDDPSTCFAALRETSYVGIPVIALCGTDNNTRFVDCAIPCNNRGKFSIGLMFWLLAREMLRMKGDPTCLRNVEWKESVDLFFYRDADKIKRQQEAKANQAQQQKMQESMGYQAEEPDYNGMPADYEAPMDDAPMYAEQDDAMYGAEQQNWEMPADGGIEDWDNAAMAPAEDLQYEQPAAQPMMDYGQPQQFEQDDGAMQVEHW